jgi:hypothetical protein
MHRRTTVTGIAVALLIAATAGCSNSDSGTDSKPSAASKITPSEDFLDSVHNTHFASWDDGAPADGDLIEFPPQWCKELKAEHSVDYIFDDQGAALYPFGSDWGTEKGEANELLVMGVKAYCPKLRAQVTKELRAAGEY